MVIADIEKLQVFLRHRFPILIDQGDLCFLRGIHRHTVRRHSSHHTLNLIYHRFRSLNLNLFRICCTFAYHITASRCSCGHTGYQKFLRRSIFNRYRDRLRNDGHIFFRNSANRLQRNRYICRIRIHVDDLCQICFHGNIRSSFCHRFFPGHIHRYGLVFVCNLIRFSRIQDISVIFHFYFYTGIPYIGAYRINRPGNKNPDHTGNQYGNDLQAEIIRQFFLHALPVLSIFLQDPSSLCGLCVSSYCSAAL